MKKERVLFVCIHNSARSQMAEAFLAKYAGDRFVAESAGLEPGTLNPVVVEAMQEIGIDISQNETNSTRQFLDEKREYDYVITVCDETSAEKCPLFPGKAQRLHWGFPDPSSLDGSPESKLAETRKIRDLIDVQVKKFIGTL